MRLWGIRGVKFIFGVQSLWICMERRIQRAWNVAILKNIEAILHIWYAQFLRRSQRYYYEKIYSEIVKKLGVSTKIDTGAGMRCKRDFAVIQVAFYRLVHGMPSQSEYLFDNKVHADQVARPAIAPLYFGLNFTATSNLSHPRGSRNAAGGLHGVLY